MVVVPGVNVAASAPVLELTEAIDVLLLLQVPPDTVLVNVAVPPGQKDEDPDIAPGTALTVTIFVAALPHPLA